MVTSNIVPIASYAQLTAYLNWGRWVADCPCNSGLLIHGSGVYRCRDCGQRSQVRMPVEWAEAERLCRNRPPKNRNWSETESIANLIAENIVHHVDGAAGPYEPKAYL